MIRYAIACRRPGCASPRFEVWFKDAAAADSQLADGRVACPSCGTTAREKAPMAPRIGRSEPRAAEAQLSLAPSPPSPTDERRREFVARLRAFRAFVEANAENVGERFAVEARAMHEGEIDERAIYGRCTPEEARDLIEDGVPCAPLPSVDRRDD